MGYQSSIYALVHGSDLIPFTAALRDHDLDGCFDQIDAEMDPEGHIRFQAFQLKWYDSYDDVTAINNIFKKSNFSCLLRVGEEAGDEEYFTGNPELTNHFDVSWQATIEF